MTLRAMTWNLWWRFGPWEERFAAIVDVVRRTDPDVLCLQEVWATESADQLELLCSELGLHGIRDEPVFHRGLAFGNAVLARWPLRRTRDEPLPRADGTAGHRRLVAAEVDSPWGVWPVASTHLDHRFDASAVRQLQIERVLEIARELRGDPDTDLPLVVGADLNAVPDSDELRLATGRRSGVDGIVFSDVWEQVGGGDGHTWRRSNPYCADSAWPDRRLDYLLVSWPRPKPVGNPQRAWLAGIDPVDVDGTDRVASDHAAVVAELTVPVSRS